MFFQNRFPDKFLDLCRRIVCHNISKFSLITKHFLIRKLQSDHLHKQCYSILFLAEFDIVTFLKSGRIDIGNIRQMFVFHRIPVRAADIRHGCLDDHAEHKGFFVDLVIIFQCDVGIHNRDLLRRSCIHAGTCIDQTACIRDQISLAHACIISACRLIKLRITGVGIFDGIEDRRFSALIFSGDQGEIFCNRNDRVGKSIPVDQLYIA